MHRLYIDLIPTTIPWKKMLSVLILQKRKVNPENKERQEERKGEWDMEGSFLIGAILCLRELWFLQFMYCSGGDCLKVILMEKLQKVTQMCTYPPIHFINK